MSSSPLCFARTGGPALPITERAFGSQAHILRIVSSGMSYSELGSLHPRTEDRCRSNTLLPLSRHGDISECSSFCLLIYPNRRAAVCFLPPNIGRGLRPYTFSPVDPAGWTHHIPVLQTPPFNFRLLALVDTGFWFSVGTCGAWPFPNGSQPHPHRLARRILFTGLFPPLFRPNRRAAVKSRAGNSYDRQDIYDRQEPISRRATSAE